jgi:aspartate racemase
MVVWYLREAPFKLTESGARILPLQPNERLLEAAKFLGTRADFLVITSNGPHAIKAEIEQVAGRPVSSMVDLVADEAVRRGWKRVGVMEFMGGRLYQHLLAGRGITIEYPLEEAQEPLNRAILALMEGRAGPAEQAAGETALNEVRGRGVDGVILGCTEVPLLLAFEQNAPDVINPI